jgi:lysophospholipase L1-like esterase
MMMKKTGLFCLISLLCFSLSTEVFSQATAKSDSLKIACIGDSITFGARLSDPSEDSYPAELQKLFHGKPVQVRNFGIGGATMLKFGTPNVWQVLEDVQEYQPDIVTIMVGTNDTVGPPRHNWVNIDDFESDYKSYISRLKALPTFPEIFLMSPTDMNLETPGLPGDRIANLESRRPRLWDLKYRIERIALDEGVYFLDMTTTFEDKPELFTEEDGVHPNAEGYEALAQEVYNAIEKEAEIRNTTKMNQ